MYIWVKLNCSDDSPIRREDFSAKEETLYCGIYFKLSVFRKRHYGVDILKKLKEITRNSGSTYGQQVRGVFFPFFLLWCAACGVLAPQSGIQSPSTLLMQWKHRVSTAGLTGKFPEIVVLFYFLQVLRVEGKVRCYNNQEKCEDEY